MHTKISARPFIRAACDVSLIPVPELFFLVFGFPLFMWCACALSENLGRESTYGADRLRWFLKMHPVNLEHGVAGVRAEQHTMRIVVYFVGLCFFEYGQGST